MIEHVYIHWPFCKKKCSYCDFISFAKHEEFITKYHQSLCNEISTFASYHNKKHKLKTIFFGGGSPNLYPTDLLKNLFELLQKKFSLENVQEVTIEVNPGEVCEKDLYAWKSFGINRLSIGVQILDEKILKKVNRAQTNRSVADLLSLAPNYFENISVDLILGLPETTSTIWFETLNYLIKQKITHISVYLLTIYEKTPLYFKVREKNVGLPSEDWLINTYQKTVEMLEQNGLFQYEISNFAHKNYESIHNRAYWNHKPYQGFGLSAASYTGKKRLVNQNNLLKYVDYWTNKGAWEGRKLQNEEVLGPNEIFLEKLMLGLRQKTGLDLHRMLYFLEVESVTNTGPKILKKKIGQLKKRGLIEEENGRVFLTTRGMILENEIVINLWNASTCRL
jgi:oxygen-independent coproporphyrinogen-3 oxidase